MTTSPVTRRRALSGAATLGLALPVLAACGSDDSTSATDGGDAATTPAGGDSSSPSSSATSADAGDGGQAGGIVSTSDVPEGSGVVIADQKVVVTQPSAGDFKCFTAICTHAGCVVANVTTTINCTCHGSSYDISTGEVVGGPAPSPLSPVDIAVKGGEVALS